MLTLATRNDNLTLAARDSSLELTARTAAMTLTTQATITLLIQHYFLKLHGGGYLLLGSGGRLRING
jgi:hypothetical protein